VTWFALVPTARQQTAAACMTAAAHQTKDASSQQQTPTGDKPCTTKQATISVSELTDGESL
jgi:hypothetical protein